MKTLIFNAGLVSPDLEIPGAVHLIESGLISAVFDAGVSS
jgi:hypothetical protein